MGKKHLSLFTVPNSYPNYYYFNIDSNHDSHLDLDPNLYLLAHHNHTIPIEKENGESYPDEATQVSKEKNICINHYPYHSKDLLIFTSFQKRVRNIFQDSCSCPVRAREHMAPYVP